jgi:hypothetical protein
MCTVARGERGGNTTCQGPMRERLRRDKNQKSSSTVPQWQREAVAAVLPQGGSSNGREGARRDGASSRDSERQLPEVTRPRPSHCPAEASPGTHEQPHAHVTRPRMTTVNTGTR